MDVTVRGFTYVDSYPGKHKSLEAYSLDRNGVGGGPQFGNRKDAVTVGGRRYSIVCCVISECDLCFGDDCALGSLTVPLIEPVVVCASPNISLSAISK